MYFKKIFFALLLALFLPLFCKAYTLDVAHKKSDKPFEEIYKSGGWSPLQNGFALGYDFGLHWFKGEIKNDANSSKTIYLEFSEPFANRCDFYILREDGSIQTFKNGLSVSLQNRAVKSPLSTAKIELKPKERVEVFVNYESRFTSYGAFRVYDEEGWRGSLATYESVFALYFGAVFIMALYNLFLFLSLRDAAYFYYVGHAFMFGVWVFLYSGISLYFIDSFWHYTLHFTTPLAFMFFTLYSISVLQTKENFPRFYKISISLAVLLLTISILVAIDLKSGYSAANAIGIIFFPFFILLAIFSIKKGVKTAKFYIAALLPYLLTMSVVANLAMGFIEYSPFAKFSFIGGSAVELTLFSLLLAYRVHILRQEQIETQNALLRLEESKAKELELMVAEKTKELKESLDDRTMLLNELHHRVKNNLQLIMAILWMEGNKTKSQDAKNALTNSAAQIKSIAAVHELLYASKNLKSIDVSEYLPQVAKNIIAASANRVTPILCDTQSVLLDSDKAVALGMVTAEIVTNSLKHAYIKNSILRPSLSLKRDGDRCRLRIADNGQKEPDELSEKSKIGLAAQMASKLKNSNYTFWYDSGVIFELEFDIG